MITARSAGGIAHRHRRPFGNHEFSAMPWNAPGELPCRRRWRDTVEAGEHNGCPGDTFAHRLRSAEPNTAAMKRGWLGSSRGTNARRAVPIPGR
jgi:hypothetical protein